MEKQIAELEQGVEVVVGHPRPRSSTSSTATSAPSPTSRSSSSTRPTAWPTWGSCPRSSGSCATSTTSTRRCSSRPPSTAWSTVSSSASAPTPPSARSSTPRSPSTRCTTASCTSTRWTRSRSPRPSPRAPSARWCSATPSAAPTASTAASRRRASTPPPSTATCRQRVRERALKDFDEGKLQVLVATDVAARGIHVDDVDVVIHYDPPTDHKTYLHRSGRTARAGESGIVVTLALWNQELEVKRLQKRHRCARPAHRRGLLQRSPPRGPAGVGSLPGARVCLIARPGPGSPPCGRGLGTGLWPPGPSWPGSPARSSSGRG